MKVEGDTILELLESMELPQLMSEHVALMEAPISSADVERAICSMKLSKAPGLDGYTLEFYRKFAAPF